jgi:hypothetical protein
VNTSGSRFLGRGAPIVLVIIVLFVVVLVVAGFATWPRSTGQEGTAIRELATDTAGLAVPSIDTMAPAATETATFALG